MAKEETMALGTDGITWDGAIVGRITVEALTTGTPE